MRAGRCSHGLPGVRSPAACAEHLPSKALELLPHALARLLPQGAPPSPWDTHILLAFALVSDPEISRLFSFLGPLVGSRVPGNPLGFGSDLEKGKGVVYRHLGRAAPGTGVMAMGYGLRCHRFPSAAK